MTVDIDHIAKEIFAFDAHAEAERIAGKLRSMLRNKLKKRGLVVAVSGGIDSAVSCALAVKAVGAERTFALLLPERDSSSSSEQRGRTLVEQLGVRYLVQDIAGVLEAVGCYQWRDEAIRKLFPDYGDGWKNKIAISGGVEGAINHFRIVVEDPEGNRYQKRLGIKEYLTIVAATNYKQRVRKTIEFFHGDRLNYAVVGTPNRVEYDQGFFVKNGDGSADLKPIAHLYKTQVYALAKDMGLPAEICNAAPTTDTYSLSQGQDEFYYHLPYKEMDVALWCFNNDKSALYLAELLGIRTTEAEYIYGDIASKRRTTAPLHWAPLLVEDVPGPLGNPKQMAETAPRRELVQQGA
ncbi:NAD(+) synthase [Gilvimarinus sp. F26214L]|uniref:NAD(+) synthase n=1 Tax=Gilvimarinus sp. DZF01 TaxID=3461371 RepID=UPI00404542EC